LPVHTFCGEGKPVLVTTKEHMMSTTTETSLEGGILTIDQAAAYLSPEGDAVHLADPACGFWPRAGDGVSLSRASRPR
jgi:hypothetical protein